MGGGAYIRNNIFVWKWIGLYPGGLKLGGLKKWDFTVFPTRDYKYISQVNESSGKENYGFNSKRCKILKKSFKIPSCSSFVLTKEMQR